MAWLLLNILILTPLQIICKSVDRPLNHFVVPTNDGKYDVTSWQSRFRDYLGDDIRIERLSNLTVQENRRVMHGSELKCDLDGRKQKCCWLNWAIPGSKFLPWIPASGTTKWETFGNSFKNVSLPDGTYFLAANDASYTNSAELVSCTLECSDYEIDVSLNYWASEGVKLKVCMRSVNDFDKLAFCQEAEAEGKSRQVDLSFPAAEYVNIVIKATLTGRAFAVINNISVYALPCATSTAKSTTMEETTISLTLATTTTSPETSTSRNDLQARLEACEAVECNFERKIRGKSPMCQYINMEFGGKKGITREWKIAKGAYRIREAKGAGDRKGPNYATTHLLPSDVAAMETSTFFDRDFVIRFLVYKATESVDLRGCCSNLTVCPYSTENNLDHAEFGKWNEANFMCPNGTQKIIFYGYNLGESPGTIAINDVRLFIPNGPVHRKAYMSACP